MPALDNIGLDPAALYRFLEEQVYSLPGTDRHREEFSVLLTGSRATAMFSDGSDVDVDVVCPREVYNAVHRASREAGIANAEKSFFCFPRGGDPQRYFGEDKGYPHYSLTPLDTVERHFRDYEDVQLWVWTNAKVISDPGKQFGRLVRAFTGYPRDVLMRKLKYRWLRSEYAAIDVFPNHPSGDEDLLPAMGALSDAIADLLRLFFLVEGKPFPYTEKLMRYAPTTALGRKWGPSLQRLVALAVGKVEPESDPWTRLDRARELLICEDTSEEARQLWEDCSQAMLAAGVEPEWVEADYHNIDELLNGELGPAP
jgi:hypothetical protein